MDGQGEVYLTPQQVADRFQVSYDVLKRWRRDGSGPPWLTLGRLVRYRLSDVDTWAAEQAQRAS